MWMPKILSLRNFSTLVLASTVVASAAHAEAFKWTDENGVVHFSRTAPPRDANYEIIETTEGYPSLTQEEPEVSATETKKTGKDNSSRSTSDWPKVSKKFSKEEQENLKENCIRVKQDLDGLQSNERIRVNGELVSDEQRQSLIEERNKWLNEYCD